MAINFSLLVEKRDKQVQCSCVTNASAKEVCCVLSILLL